MKCPASGCGLEWDDFNHIKDHDCLQALIDFEQTENTRLKAQVGRLRFLLVRISDHIPPHPDCRGSIPHWLGVRLKDISEWIEKALSDQEGS